MSKYTRLNKINHYHDSKSSMKATVADLRGQTKINAGGRNKTRIVSISIDGAESGSSGSTFSGGNFSGGNCCSGSPMEVDLDVEPDLVGAKATSLLGRPIRSRNNISIRRRRMGAFRCDSSALKQIAFFAFFILATIIVCSEMRGVSSLNCYHCSSVDNPGCDESFSGRANFTETDCSKHISQPAKVCRKIVQYIEDKKVVLRSCGYIDEHEGKEQKTMCYKRSGTFAIMMESCNCYEDNCNHSASLVPSESLLLMAAGGLLLVLAASARRAINIRPLPLAAN